MHSTSYLWPARPLVGSNFSHQLFPDLAKGYLKIIENGIHRTAADMRAWQPRYSRQQRIVWRNRFVGPDIDTRTIKCSIGQGFIQRLLVNHIAAPTLIRTADGFIKASVSASNNFAFRG
jgi:hypothetical protein